MSISWYPYTLALMFHYVTDTKWNGVAIGIAKCMANNVFFALINFNRINNKIKNKTPKRHLQDMGIQPVTSVTAVSCVTYQSLRQLNVWIEINLFNFSNVIQMNKQNQGDVIIIRMTRWLSGFWLAFSVLIIRLASLWYFYWIDLY